jgi:monoterpene epsilon-lactone hydrolase
MITSIFKITILSALLLTTYVSRAEAVDSWNIEARTVPIPIGASAALQKSLALRPAPDVSLRKAQAPKTRAEWDALIAQRKTQVGPLEGIEKNYDVTIRKDTIANVPVYWVIPNNPVRKHKQHLMFYVHGGAYVFGGGDASVREAANIARTAGITAISIDYRMPPEHPFPAAVDDAVAVYKVLLKDYKSRRIAFGGTSAGAGLALATVHKLKSLALGLPGAIYAGTPWADLTKTGDTLFTNEGLDRVLVTYDGSLGAAARLYANGHDMKDPLLSPVYGDFKDFPPVILITGTRDMFLSDTARTHRKLREAGVVADLHVFEALSHAGYAFDVKAPESTQAYGEIAAFLHKHLK